jgi:hypothetical protein
MAGTTAAVTGIVCVAAKAPLLVADTDAAAEFVAGAV